MQHKHLRSSFTLVGFSVVIAVTAILVSFLLPALAAVQSTCPGGDVQ